MPFCFAPAPQDAEPVHLRQTEIENDEVIGFRIAAEPGVLSVRRDVSEISSRPSAPLKCRR